MKPSLTQTDFVERINSLCAIQLNTEKRGGVSDANIVASQGVPTLDGWGPFGDGDIPYMKGLLKRVLLNGLPWFQGY